MLEIQDYPGYYIDNEGNVYSTKKTKKPKLLKPQKASQSKKGYFQVALYNENCRRNKKGALIGKLLYVHRLVWKTFIGKIPKGKEIDHIDGDTSNNSVDNLQTLTRRENLLKYRNREDVYYLRDYRDDMIEAYKKLKSYPKVAKKFGCGKGSVFRVIKNIYYVKDKNGVSKQRIFDTNIKDEYTKDLRSLKWKI